MRIIKDPLKNASSTIFQAWAKKGSWLRKWILNKAQATKIIKDVASAVKQWRKIAVSFGLSKSECACMASAFEHEDMDIANKL